MLKTFGGDDGLYCNFTDKGGVVPASSRVRYLPWVFSLLMLCAVAAGGGKDPRKGAFGRSISMSRSAFRARRSCDVIAKERGARRGR